MRECGMMKQKSEVTARIDQIEAGICRLVKPSGFRKHGRTLHRFVDEDISQVINFQPGQAYLNMTHLMTVNLGIRVPECFERTFSPSAPMKKYCHEYECNIRSRLGEIDGGEVRVFDLRGDMDAIEAEIVRDVETKVLPVFDALSSRNAILLHRRDYPHFDTLNDHLILLEEAMIYGRRGQKDKAKALFEQYYQGVFDKYQQDKDAKHLKGHLSYLDGLAGNLGLR